MLEYLTYSNGILLLEYYHYYVLAHSIFTSFIIVYKIYGASKTVYFFFFPRKQIDYNTNSIDLDGWIFI